MKRLLCVLFLILLCAALISSCATNPFENNSNLAQNSGEAELVFPETPVAYSERVFKNTDGKYGLLDENANVIVEPTYIKAFPYENIIVFVTENEKNVVTNYSGETLGEYDRIEKKSVLNENFFIAQNINGTRMELDPNDVDSIEIVEVENASCYVLNDFGEPVLEEFYDDISIGIESDENIHIYAVRDGNRYEYVKNSDSFALIEEKIHGETGFGNFGYKEVVYFWNIWRTGYGLIDDENNVVFEPIYKRIRVPFEDRVLLFTGDIVSGYSICSIASLDGQIIAKFGNIEYTFFDDGSYIGIAFANETAGNFNSGDTVTYGWYFIDKNGKIISDLFLSYPDIQNENEPYSPESTFNVISKSGEEITLSLKDYICEP